jgi:4-amino-4-deoxy-L-arabinose transferase-like glycosyltransferase
MIPIFARAQQALTRQSISKLWRSDWSVPILLALTLLALRIWYVTSLTPYGLAPDEAQYWHWLTHNNWSFLTKPPLTTWAIGLSTAVFGDTMLGVKFWALLSQASLPLLGMLLAREVATQMLHNQASTTTTTAPHTTRTTNLTQAHVQTAGWWAYALLQLCPLLHLGGLIMAPDALLTPLWFATLWLTCIALRPASGHNRTTNWRIWCIIGVCVGLAGLAKYNAALYYPLLALFIFFNQRHTLFSKRILLIIISGLIALLLQAPVLYWNASHNWLGFSHLIWQMDGGGDARHGGFGSLLDLFLNQWLVVGLANWPLLLITWVVFAPRLWQSLQQPKHNAPAGLSLLWWFTAPIMFIFLILSFTGKVQANWPLLATLPGLVLVAIWLSGQAWASSDPFTKALKPSQNKIFAGMLWVGLLASFALTTLLYASPTARHLGVPLRVKIDPTKDLLGWPDMGQLLGLSLQHLENPIILSTRYQTLAPLAFHTPRRPETLYLNAEKRRSNHYDTWAWPDLTARIVVYVNEQGVLPLGVAEMFQNCLPFRNLAVEETLGVFTRKLATWICWQPRIYQTK